MRVFLVLAHPEPRSFNAALASEAVDALRAAGHETVVSDLYAMGFDPVSDRRNFTSVLDPDVYRQQAEEVHATEHGGFVPEIAAEQEKLLGCDALVLQFPLWWFGLPAILKGWVDRVFAMGKLYGGGRWYDRGVLAGRRAMVSVTTGGPESIYRRDGLHGDIREILFPVHHGILHFTGFEVLPPFIAYGPSRADEAARKRYRAEYRDRIDALFRTEPLLFPHLDEYGPDFRLRRPDKTG